MLFENKIHSPAAIKSVLYINIGVCVCADIFSFSLSVCFCFTWRSFERFRTLAKRRSFNNDRKTKKLLLPLTHSRSFQMAREKCKEDERKRGERKVEQKNALTHNP